MTPKVLRQQARVDRLTASLASWEEKLEKLPFWNKKDRSRIKRKVQELKDELRVERSDLYRMKDALND